MTGGTWGSDEASAFNTALTASAWTLLTEVQQLCGAQPLSKVTLRALGLPNHLN